MNSRSRKPIPNLKIDGIITLFKNSDTYGMIWHQGANASSGHLICTFKVNDECIFVSNIYIYSRERFIFCYISL